MPDSDRRVCVKKIQKWLTGLGFTAGLLVLLLLASFILMPKGNGEKSGFLYRDAKGIIAEKKNTVDVIFLGDSEVYSTISPMQLWKEQGMTSYDCSTGGQRLFDTLSLLKTALENQKPELVVLEMNATFRQFSVGEVAYNKAGEFFSVFAYHDRWKWFHWSELLKKKDFSWTSDLKGFRLQTGVQAAKKKLYKTYMKNSKKFKSLPEKNVSYIDAIQQICEDNGIRLLLLNVPSSKNWSMRKHNTIADLAEKRNLSYLDLNLLTDELGINWETDTKDEGDHLNYFGAVKVSTYLGNYLKENYALPDHRGDKTYASWDDCLKRYQQQVDTLQNRIEPVIRKQSAKTDMDMHN